MLSSLQIRSQFITQPTVLTATIDFGTRLRISRNVDINSSAIHNLINTKFNTPAYQIVEFNVYDAYIIRKFYRSPKGSRKIILS